jgi:hypothetical protein
MRLVLLAIDEDPGGAMTKRVSGMVAVVVIAGLGVWVWAREGVPSR